MHISGLRFVLIYLFYFVGSQLTRDVTASPNRNWTIERTRRAISNDEVSCTLPSHPENGKWLIMGVSNASPGEKISINSVLKFECNTGYKLAAPSPYMVCDQNWNSLKQPTCEELCPPMYSTTIITLTCRDKEGLNIDCHEATDGSILTYQCASFYETPFGYRKTILCQRGSWSFPKPVCQPICGKQVNNDTLPLIYGGKVQKGVEFPWIVALYQKIGGKLLNICGGSLISQRLILTAAHCVTNGYGEVLPKENYHLGAGKYRNAFNDSLDTQAQYSEISRITVHPGYKGDLRQFIADLAILEARISFKLSFVVQPVCFNDVNNIHLHAGSLGVVSGWGLKEGGVPSEELRTLEIPYKYETTCAQELPREWGDKYNTIDKICAGFYNKNMSVCPGDSGNGLVFKNPENNRFYIHGLVSLGPSERGECNVQQNSLYTKIAFYYEFIDKELGKYDLEDCKLPPYPKNGIWKITEAKTKVPGEHVSSGAVLKVSCNDGFILSSDFSNLQCLEAVLHMPACLALCPVPNAPPTTVFDCKNNNGEVIECSKAPDGSVLTYTCPEGYEVTEKSKTIRCLKGSWEKPVPTCQRTVNTQKSSVVCTYASWESYEGVNPENFNASLCDYLLYAFVGLSADGKLRVQDKALDLGTNNNGLYKRVTDLKKINTHLKVLLSVGGSGASNSSLFSSMAADSGKRSAFIESSKYFLETYSFDGLDIEWHVPDVADKENYITLLREVHTAFKQHGYLLTVSVRSHPESTGYDGTRMNDVVDWINVKTYNMYGEWSQYTGQNSALFPSSVEYEWEKQHLNIEASLKNWLAIGAKKEKLVPCIAFYGKSFTLEDKNQHGVHAAIKGAGPGKSGSLKYSEICEKYSSWTRQWDDEQKNPYKYFEDKWIGYDDEESVGVKAAYFKENGYLKVNVWPVDADDIHGKCGTKQILLKTVRSKLDSN